MDYDKLTNAILASCPKLTDLTIHASYVDLSRLVTAYEHFQGAESMAGISSVTLLKVDTIGLDHGVRFAELLGDPSSRLARHLEELCITSRGDSDAVNSSTLRALWFALKANTKLKKLEIMTPPSILKQWKLRFRQLHGQVLPPESLPTGARLAFLSVTRIRAEAEEDKEQSSIQLLDQRVLSLVLEFAATRVVRSVTLFYSL